MNRTKLVIYSLVALGSASIALASVPHKLTPRALVAAGQSQSTRTGETISVYIAADPAELDRNALSDLGATITTEVGEMFTVRIPLSALAELESVRGIRYIDTGSPVAVMVDKAAQDTGAADVRSGNTLSQPYTGKGVIVGIVDSGFDYGHIAFRDSEGKLRISRVWEQSTEATGSQKAPESFGYGVEFDTPEAILAAGGDVMNVSHATHVTNIAAGSDDYLDGILLGMAPESELVLVSIQDLGSDNVTISDAIAYIFDYADAAGKPCVINLSLGNHAGPHDGTSAFDVMADGLVGKGRLIVGSAGNHRADKFHISRDFSGTEGEAPLQSFIDFKRGTNVVGGDIEIWGSEGSDMNVELVTYRLSNGEAVESVTVYPLEEGAAELSLGRNVTGNVTVASGISPLNGKPHAFIKSGITGIRTGYAVAVKVSSANEGSIDVWADNSYLALSSKGIDGFEEPGNATTICEIGGTANRILTVGAYSTRDKFVLFNDTKENESGETLGNVCSFSSYGPTADGRMKPQVSAPGSLISSAVSSNDNSGSLLISQVHSDGEKEHLYGFMQGTSMASPMVTGIVATWLQAYPEMSPEELIEVVRKTSRHDEFTGALEEDDCDWGYGKIDALAGITECLRLKESVSVPGVANADTNVDAVTLENGNISIIFGASRRNVSVDVWSAIGNRCYSSALQRVRAGDSASVDVLALPKGVFILTISSSEGSQSFKFVR